MPSSYSDVADKAQDRGVLDPHHVDRQAVKDLMGSFVHVGDPNSPGGKRLLDEATDAAMEQGIRRDDGAMAGRRNNVHTWEDMHGNIMYQHMNTGTRKKLVDKNDI